MEGPADTLSYFIAGYVVIFSIMLVYLTSLIVRYRNLRQEEEVLMTMEEKDS
jgi:hypothetical protein